MIKKFICGSFFSNCYLLVNDKKCIIIDPGLNFNKYAEIIKKEYDVVAILLTHGHIDHIDGLKYFDVPIYIYKDEVPFLEDADLALYSLFNVKKDFDVSRLNIVKINDNYLIDLLDFKIKVIHTPGHTVGSVCYLYENNLFSGDTLFNLSVGRVDFPTGDFKQLDSSLKKLFNLPADTIVYPGHGEATTIGFEKNNNPYR